MTVLTDGSNDPRRRRVRIPVPSEQLEELGEPSRARSQERFVVVRSPELPAFEVFDVWGSTRLWKVFHTVFDFCIPRRSVQRGEQRWVYRGQEYEAGPTSTMVMEPGEVHRTVRVATPGDFYVLRVDESAMRELTRELGEKPWHFRSGQIDDAVAQESALQVAREIAEGRADPLCVESKLLEFLRRALDLGGERALRVDPTPCKRAVNLARQYIHGHFATRLTLDEIAQASGRTKWHLARSFKEVLGVTIHEYLTLVRLDHAKNRLRMGVLPKVAAADAGFADQAHLTRKLSRYLGITPARYRRGQTLSRDQEIAGAD